MSAQSEADAVSNSHIGRTAQPPTPVPFSVVPFLPVGDAVEYAGYSTEMGWRLWNAAVMALNRLQRTRA